MSRCPVCFDWVTRFGVKLCTFLYISSTLTCSFEVTAQKTISVKPWVGNIRKQIPPITRPSLIRANVLCFLKANRGQGQNRQQIELCKRRVIYNAFCLSENQIIWIKRIWETKSFIPNNDGLIMLLPLSSSQVHTETRGLFSFEHLSQAELQTE